MSLGELAMKANEQGKAQYSGQYSEQDIRTLYQSLSKEQPSDLLDELILNKAKSVQPKKRLYATRSWSVAASFLVIGFTSYLVLQQPKSVSDGDLAFTPPINENKENNEKNKQNEQLETDEVLSDIASNNTNESATSFAKTAQSAKIQLASRSKQVVAIPASVYPINGMGEEVDKLVEQYQRLAQKPELTADDKTQLEIIQKEVFTQLARLRDQHPDIAVNPSHLSVLTEKQLNSMSN